ncbi:MAG: metal-dependent hydrolase [Alphaproteobacteria bacterium]
MPTFLSHPAVPLALAYGLGGAAVPRRLMMVGVTVSILPDLDVLAFQLGIPYLNAFGHRGFSHSITLAVIVALITAMFARRLGSEWKRVFAFVGVSMGSHGLLDAFTNGGQGIALLWPFTDERYFAPVQMIEVAPLRLARFFSERGVEVMLSELVWVWLPCGVVMASLLAIQGRLRRPWSQSAGEAA